MDSQYTSFTGSVPENYDKYLGPFLFDYFAGILTERLSQIKPSKILDIACGTGIVTKKIEEALPKSHIIGLDLNPDMIEFGKKKLKNSSIEWKVSNAINLPFDNDTFDAVVCQFGVMFFPDKAAAFIEARRVLKPNGTFIFNTWDSLEINELFLTSDRVIGRIFTDNPPDFYKVPFSFYDTKEIEKLLNEAGFRDIKLEYVKTKAENESVKALAIGLVEGNPIYGQITERDASKVPVVKSEIEKEVSSKFGDNPVKADLSAIMCTCRK
ncbi:MAG: methyltransferase domain-containing protein [Ignavibacteriae bacterium]|nr:MAG: methyltransferase domain-containing protein [Ignavibacteriota bacterium]